MDFYFYCTYEQSPRGFFPTKLEGDRLIPADGSCGVTIPDMVEEFFDHDRFRILWREYPAREASTLFPDPYYGLFGIRRIKSMIGDRPGVVNIAITAEQEELYALEDIAVSVICGYKEFGGILNGCFDTGGECGYMINAQRFTDIIDRKPDLSRLKDSEGGKMLLGILKRDSGVLTVRDLLRFAVRTAPWSEIRTALGNGILWMQCPSNVITEEQFDEKF